MDLAILLIKRQQNVNIISDDGVKDMKIKAIQFRVDGFYNAPFAFGGEEDPSKEEVGEDMLFFTQRHEIGVTSSLRDATEVQIVSISGVTIASFTIQPGETVKTFIPVSGVYIVRGAGGRYQKKLAVK